MKKISRRSFLLATGTVSLAAALTACGGTDDSKPETTGNEGNEGAEAKEISVAALASAYTNAYPAMWEDVCAAFTEETGIKVSTLTVEKELEDVIGPSMQSGDFPDVVTLATGRKKGLTDDFVKNKLIAEVTDVLSLTIPGESVTVGDKLMDGFIGGVGTNPYGDDKTYLVPMFYTTCGLFYNAGLFAEKGWKVPETWDEMWELGETAKKEGIYLFSYATPGYFDTFLPTLLMDVGGKEFFEKATHFAEGIWDTPEAEFCFEVFEKVAKYTNPITPAQANGTDYMLNQGMILENKALFMPNGNWVIGEMADSPRADNFEWGMTVLPAAKEGGDRYGFVFMEQAWIPAGAAHIDEAKQFLAFMYSDKAASIFAQGGAVQPIEGAAEMLADETTKALYASFMDGAKVLMGGFASYKAEAGLGTVNEVFLQPLNGMVSGELTREAWVKDVKAASDKMRANLL